jgi:hypothetical protein
MKIIIFCIVISSCADWSFGLDNKENNISSQQLLQQNHCTNDSQCVSGNICVKNNNAYIGECIRIVNKSEQLK